ncbi:Sigma factor RpoE regulatory protein RseC [Klebsiella pneumoniae]|uniref:Sigma factor RpoE regulatory protein RseC n=1 Tax=Klebsiella pneumoniae TaxID=573 RepID=A0A447RNK4_KLEPN|nr:Sigma factor RpoE regulatory protein RseC [Klebsiella pneumoniae]
MPAVVSRVLNKLGPQTSHTISVPCEQPLAAGQKVELGIAESSLLGSAMLVYMAPLAGAVCNGVYFSGAVCQ